MIYRYCGGKNKKSIVNKILSKAPNQYDEARFPFCGSCGIFWDIDINISRWINDIDEDLMSVYFALRDRADEFIKLCREIKPPKENEPLTSARPGGKNIYNARLKEVFDRLIKDSSSDRALKYFFINRTVWGGRVNYDMPSRLYYSNPSGWNIVKTDKLERAAKILQGVKITCGDYSGVLEEAGKDTWIYIDPPYYSNSKFNKGSKLYKYNFTKEDHIKLSEKVKNCKHKVLLSYDDDIFIRNLYEGFNIYEESWTYSGTSLNKKEIGKELIITNY